MCTISCVDMLRQDELLPFDSFRSLSVWEDELHLLQKQILAPSQRFSPYKEIHSEQETRLFLIPTGVTKSKFSFWASLCPSPQNVPVEVVVLFIDAFRKIFQTHGDKKLQPANTWTLSAVCLALLSLSYLGVCR